MVNKTRKNLLQESTSNSKKTENLATTHTSLYDRLRNREHNHHFSPSAVFAKITQITIDFQEVDEELIQLKLNFYMKEPILILLSIKFH